MKMYFSKLAKVLLAGVVFVAVGCTDYKDDIDSINDKLENDVIAGMIEPLKADLEKAVADLEAAQAALKSELTTKHDADVKTLKDADAALDGKIAAANQSILDLQAALAAEKAALEGKIAALETALAAAEQAAKDGDAALDAKLTAEINKTKQDLQTALATEKAALEAKISALESALAAAEKAAQDANDALEAKLAAQITAIEADLEKQIADLQAKHDKDIADLKKVVDDNKAAADAQFKVVADQVAALELKDTELEAELAKQAKLIADLDAKVDANYKELSETIEAVRKNLQEQVYANKAAIDANKASINAIIADAEQLTADVRALEQKVYGIEGDLVKHLEEYANYKALVAGKLEAMKAAHDALVARVADLEENVIPAMKAQIAKNAELANQNAAEIAKNAALFEQYKQAAQQTYEQLLAADAKLAESIELLGGDIEEVNADLQAYKATIEGELKEHYEAYEQYKSETDERIADAVAAENAHYLELNAKHNAQEAALAQLKALLDAEIAAREQGDAALRASIASLEDVVDALAARVAVLEAGLAELKAAHEELVGDFEAFKKQISLSLINSINALQEQMALNNAAIYGTIADLQAQHDADVAALKEADKKLHKSIENLAITLDKAIKAEAKAREEADAALQEQIDSILAMIQSVVYVPEYTDGKATVNYAEIVGNDAAYVVEGYSTITYKVYPAECADALALLDTKEIAKYLAFDMTDELKVRNAATNNKLTVVKVDKVEGKPGHILITYQANGLPEVFYRGRDGQAEPIEYAISLHVTVNNSDLSSCYTNIVAAVEPILTITPTLVPSDSYDEKQQFVPAVAQEIEYLKTGESEALPMFPNGLVVKYDIGDASTYTLAQMLQKGWVLSEAPATPNQEIYNADGSLYTGTAKLFENGVLAEVEKYWLGADVKGDHVGMYSDYYRGFVINGIEDVTLYATSRLTIAPDTAVTPFELVNIKWYYTADAEQDAAADPVYARTNLTLAVDETYYEQNPDDKTDLTWDKIIEVVPSVTINGQTMTADGVQFSIGVDSKNNPVLNVTGFDWWNANEQPMKYDVVFKYELPAVTLVAKVTVTTTDRSREKITIDYGKFDREFYRDMTWTPFTEEIAPVLPLSKVYEAINAAYDLGLNTKDGGFASLEGEDGKIAIDEERQLAFLKEVLGNGVDSKGYDAAFKRVATDFGENPATETKTVNDDYVKNFGIKVTDEEQAVSLGYSYRSYKFIPETVVYTVNYTLWYGQEVELVAELNIMKPKKYNFEYSILYVKNGDACDGASYEPHALIKGLFSSVYPFYDPDLKTGTQNGVKLRDFNTEKVDMDKAFNIVDTTVADANARILTAEQIAEAGLVADFELEETYDFSEYNAGKDADAQRVLEWAEEETIVTEGDVNKVVMVKTNKLIYNADVCHAPVTGNLYIVNTKGPKLQLTTNFDTEEAYQDYVVKKYDPILDPVLVGAKYATAPEKDAIPTTKDVIDIEISSAKEYVLNPLLCIELKDYRNGYKNFDLINRQTGEWVKGGESSVHDGFAKGRDVRDIYKLGIEWTESPVPAQLRKVIYMTRDNKVVFDNTGEQVLVEPFTYTVTLKITSPWGTHSIDIPFRFFQGGDLGKTE